MNCTDTDPHACDEAGCSRAEAIGGGSEVGAMTMTMTLYKILPPGREPAHGGSGAWPPPGEWRSEPGPLTLCVAGTLHLCRAEDLPRWLVGDGEVWEAEAAGDVVAGSDKVGCLRARLLSRVGVLTHGVLLAITADAVQIRCAVVRLRLERDWRGDGRPEAALQAAEAIAALLVGGGARSADAAADAYAADAADAYAAARASADAAADAAYAAAAAAAAGVRHWLGQRLLALLAGEAGEVDYRAVAAGWAREEAAGRRVLAAVGLDEEGER